MLIKKMMLKFKAFTTVLSLKNRHLLTLILASAAPYTGRCSTILSNILLHNAICSWIVTVIWLSSYVHFTSVTCPPLPDSSLSYSDYFKDVCSKEMHSHPFQLLQCILGKFFFGFRYEPKGVAGHNRVGGL